MVCIPVIAAQAERLTAWTAAHCGELLLLGVPAQVTSSSDRLRELWREF
jgi:hypothetical protein